MVFSHDGFWKGFYWLNYSFPLAMLKKICFSKSNITWFETILRKPKSCVISYGKVTQWNRGTLPRDSIFAYLTILVMEALFT